MSETLDRQSSELDIIGSSISPNDNKIANNTNTQPNSSATFAIEGMTCASCVMRIERS